MSAQKWAILLLIIALLLTSTCAVASAASTQGGVVQINSPSKNGKAGPTQPVSGKAQLLPGYTLWIVPYDPTTGIYYPKAPSLTVRSDASWSTRLSVGNIFGVGKVFQIYAVVANPSASNALSNYAAQKTGIAKQLPAGAQAVDAAMVTRVAADVSSTASASPSPTPVPSTTSAVTSSATAEASPSATTVAGVGSGVTSSNPLPGFEAVFALGALGALAAIFVVIRWTRQR